ncbi:MAG TPA: hypothetical protein VMC86_07950, partial [Gemmatimonadales bacterium]|nr:hypothetical protein [Gemmatimonadales bacterium]
ATQLVFTTQPADATVNTTMAGVVVTAEDQFGNVDPTFVGNVGLVISNDPNGGASVLSGTIPQTAVAGVATFSDLQISQVGPGFTLQASSGGVSSATSNSFNITP